MKLKASKKNHPVRSIVAKKSDPHGNKHQNGDNRDGNHWDCTVCTYQNSAETFKCVMCDVRKGTSTRKPHISLDLVAKQVVRQQQDLMSKSNSCSSIETSNVINERPAKDHSLGKATKKRQAKLQQTAEIDTATSTIEAVIERVKESLGKSLLKEKKIRENKNKIKLGKRVGKVIKDKILQKQRKNHQNLGCLSRKKTVLKERLNSPGPSHAKVKKGKRLEKLKKKFTSESLSSSQSASKSLESNLCPSNRANVENSFEMVEKSDVEKCNSLNLISAAITVNSITVIITEFIRDEKPEKKDVD